MEERDQDINAFNNDLDQVMEDVDEPEHDPEPEPRSGPEGEGEEVDEGDYTEPDLYTGPGLGDAPSGGASNSENAGRAGIAPSYSNEDSGVRGAARLSSAAANGTAIDSAESMAAAVTASSRRNSTSPHAASLTLLPTSRLQPRPRSEAIFAKIYDIVPTMAAPQATSINALAVTPDLRYWMTGGSDGYIRKYDGPGTINGRQLLTVAQRHPFVDSVVKAGILMSYWENEEPSSASTRGVEEHILSPVYSLAIHSRALWLLAGTESGGINLQSVRHDEGKRITCLQRHTNAVSVLQLAPDEKSVLSGSWDKAIFDWDLNTGQVRREFDGSSGQLSAIELRPASGSPMPAQSFDDKLSTDTDVTLTSSGTKPLPNGVPVSDPAAWPNTASGVVTAASGASGIINGNDPLPDHESLFGSPGGSLFGESDAIGAIAFEDEGFTQDEDGVADTAHTTMNAFVSSANLPVESSPAETFREEGHRPFTPSEIVSEDAVADLKLQSNEADAPMSPRATGESLATLSGASNDHASQHADAVHFGGDLAANSTSPRSQQQQQQQQQQQWLDQELQQSAETQLLGGEEAETFLLEANPKTKKDTISEPQEVADEEKKKSPTALIYSSQSGQQQFDPTQVSENTFLSATIDGLIRIWDRRQNLPVARIGLRPGVPPWCMSACWSPDGNRIYAGRRNGTVEEFDIHKAKAGWQPERALRFPAGSGPVSAVRAMVNGRHLVCASHDILRLYDVQQTSALPHSNVPFLIIPGPPRPGVISHLYVDQTSRYLISIAGTRGWEGHSTETLIGYEITSILK
ncbi:Transcription factor spt8 [Sporothrix epigloea]|uniref:Transcription factor spt8 n=1 Tax=Sporothrix epigloea TaxID=1892477 RepID=A0ABP0E6S0_9PEZI